MIEQRRVRFLSIAGISREDLPLACEVWISDLCSAPWVSREAMKLGCHMVRYICKPDPAVMNMRDIENQCQISHEDVRKALSLMRTFGAADNFYCDRTDLRVALNLTFFQRLRVLEAKHRFGMMANSNDCLPWTVPPEPWLQLDSDSTERRSVS